MPRPRRSRRVFGEPQFRCFRPEEGTDMEPVLITLDEFESVRLKDYQKIQQKKAAELMGISQPTFHRTLSSAREKIAKALVEGKIIKIKGGICMSDEKRYRCSKCGFEWHSPTKEYDNCPDCGSEEIVVLKSDEAQNIGQPGMGMRRSFGGPGRRAGPPSVCRCTECGYETEKTPGIPCRENKCPKCGGSMCGAD